jgi:hypothetical protein
MEDILSGGILGSVFGGLFRLAPEVLKFFDRKNERQHELKMFEQQCELESQRGAQRMQEIGAQHAMAVDQGALDAFTASIQQQAEMVKAAGKGWVASLSASVRPVVTYLLVGVYLGLQLTMATHIMLTGGSVADVFKFVMTQDFVALVCGILNYHFLNRTLEKRGLM